MYSFVEHVIYKGQDKQYMLHLIDSALLNILKTPTANHIFRFSLLRPTKRQRTIIKRRTEF